MTFSVKCLCLILLLLSANGYGQDNYIDSLKYTTVNRKDDSLKVDQMVSIAWYYNTSDLDSSVKYFQIALHLAENLHYERGTLNAEIPLTILLAFQGNYPLALDIGFKAISHAKKIGTPLDNVISLGNLVYVYHFLGDYSKGISSIYEAVNMVEKSYPDSLAFIYAGYSMLLEDVGKHDSALYYAKKSYQQLLDWKYENIFPTIYPQLGNAFYSTNKIDSAIFYYSKGIDVAIGSNWPADEIDCYIGIARLYKTKGISDSAIWYAKKVLAHKFGKSYRDGLFKAATILAAVFKSNNKPDSALVYMQKAIDLKDSLFNRQKTIAIQNLEAREQQKLIDIENSKREYRNRLKLWGLWCGAGILLGIAFLQWYNNRQRKKAYTLLQKQERETDLQKHKVEKSLKELKETQAQLINAEKMASLGEMTAGIAHEIQNPLNFINNFAEINRELIAEINLQRSKHSASNGTETELLHDIDQNLEKISHHGKRADGIVKSMLEHSRTKSGQKEFTDINALAEEYVRLSYHAIRAKDKFFSAAIKTDYDPSIPKMELIPQDIGRVLMNLYNNAFYSVSEKNNLKIPGFEPVVSISTKRLADKLEIRVTDNGFGIPENIKEKIFQPFFTTKPTGQGTGLGLSISHDIIKVHNGVLEVISTEGKGTSMVVVLPLGELT